MQFKCDCEDCQDSGYSLVTRDDNIKMIQRCDTCKIMTDERAIQYAIIDGHDVDEKTGHLKNQE